MKKPATLPVVISQAPHEKEQVARLVQYCRDLDGTEVQVFGHEEPAGMSYPEVANHCFRETAKTMRGKPFIWIEADCAPLQPGWVNILTQEYHRQGKEYLYPLQFNPPHDIYSGIGVQGPHAYEHAPVGWTAGGFDEWIVKKHPDKIGRTSLIRHTYGQYDEKGDVTLHQFPRDLNVIGPEAVLFHKDKAQGLIDYMNAPGLAISSSGDIGDCVYLLNLIRQIPGGRHTLALRSSQLTKAKDDEKVRRLYDTIASLAHAQRYIRDVVIIDADTKVDWASEGFRKLGHFRKGETLMQAHLHHLVKTLGLSARSFHDNAPWLNVVPDRGVSDRVVINRTARYRNDRFPWERIVQHLGSRLLFVGLEDEWRQFCRDFGSVEYRPTTSMLEVAQLIAGSSLFIGNQSSAYACAEGLKHNSIQETCLELPDCVYPRPNAQYVADGVVTLPDGTVLRPPGKPHSPQDRKTMESPPGMWQYPGYGPHSAFAVLTGLVSRNEGITVEEASEKIYAANQERCPTFFQDGAEQHRMHKFNAAVQRV